MTPKTHRRRFAARRTEAVQVAAESLEDRSLLSATIQNIANINLTNPWGAVREVESVGADTYFVTSEANSSNLDLWKSNGTTGGTIRLAGLGPVDNQSRQLTNVNGTLYFRGYDAVEGHELWKSNGTVAGTSIVRSLRTGIGSSTLTDLTNFNGTLAFSGNGDLYKSNGTSAGTVRVSDLIARTSDEVAELEPVGNKLFFRAKSSAGGFDLYRTDGTRAGTSKVANVPAGDLTKLTKVGSSLYFVRNDSELWKTSADNSTSSMIAAATPQTKLVDLDGILYFSDNGYLLKSNGTPQGTLAVGFVGDFIDHLYAWNGAVYFSGGTEFTQQTDGPELWRSDGTTGVTVQLKDINPRFNEGYLYGSSPEGFTEAGGKLYFWADSGLWTTDGTTAGTVKIDNSVATSLSNANGTLHFFKTQAGGLQLRKLDATATTPVDVVRTGPGSGSSSPTEPVLHNGSLYFAADDSISGMELRRRNSNGTIELVADITPGQGGTGISELTSVNGLLYFHVLTSGFKQTFWRSDGTAAGTFKLADVAISSSNGNNKAPKLVPVGNKVFFAGSKNDDVELWKSDGTVAGTALVKNILPGFYPGPYQNYPYSSGPFELTNVNGTLYFAATDPVVGREIWKSDGTEAGTVVLKDIRPGTQQYYPYGLYSSSPTSLSNVNGTLHFMAYDGSGIRFFQSDGTTNGTVPVSTAIPKLNSVKGSTNINGKMFFVGSDQTTQNELWISDGTPSGTVLLKDIRPGNYDPQISNMTNVDGILYFTANDGVHGNELWRSDGTTSGTVLVSDLNTTPIQGRPGSSSPNKLTALNGVLFFSVDDDPNGPQLWRTNGTADGLTRVSGFDLDVPVSAPSGLTVWNNGLLFAADSKLGRELWTLRSAPPVLTVPSTPASYVEGALPVAIAPGAVLTDADTSTLRGGRLTISILNSFANDQLRTISSQGISLAGTSVLLFSVGIGTLSASSTATSMVIDLNLNATDANVQRLIRSIAYRSTSDNPNPQTRNIKITLTDGESGIVSKLVQVNVVPVNDAPTLDGLTTTTYQRNSASGVAFAANAVVGDVDSSNFGGGQLLISVTGVDPAANRIFLTGTLFSIDTSGNLLRAGVIIGTVNANAGIGTAPFRVTFNSSAKPSFVQQLLRSLRFSTANSTSNALNQTRQISVQLSDGGIGLNSVVKTALVNVRR